MKEEDNEPENLIALDENGIEIHISQAKSGKNGYYCRGCKDEMVAVIGSLPNPYFRHIPRDITAKAKCMKTDESFRHDYAKRMLQLHKEIKVPSLFKHPPTGSHYTKVNKIKSSWVIKAHYVENEMQFFLNENDVLCWSRGVDYENKPEKHSLIQPDVAFFNEKNNPILFIEILATHKVTKPKIEKIMALGVDTVQVSVPNGTKEEIEEVFKRTDKTEWIYNEQRERTPYIPNDSSGGYTEMAPTLDGIQGIIHQSSESYECKALQIRNFIRRVRKLMDTVEFAEATKGIADEIQRVDSATKREREQWESVQEKYEAEVNEEFEPKILNYNKSEAEIALEESGIEQQITAVTNRHQKVEDRYRELEADYRANADQFEQSIRDYQPECQPEIDSIEREIRELEGKISAIEELGITYDQRVEQNTKEEQRIDYSTKQENGFIEAIESRRAELSERKGSLDKNLRAEFEVREAQFRAEIGERFDQDRDASIDAISREDNSSESRVKKRINELFEAGKLAGPFITAQNDVRRIRQAIECFDQKAWKTWE